MATRDDVDLQTLGRFIRDRRQRLDLTQTQLAERLGWVQERISVLENGKYRMPSIPAMARLAQALETSLQSLMEAAGYASQFVGNHSAPNGNGNMALYYTLQRLLEIEATTLKDALNEASDRMAEAMGADKVDAFLLDAPTQSLVALATSRTPLGKRQHEIGLNRMALANRGRTVEVYETGQTFCTGQADEDPDMVVGAVKTLGVRSMLAVPLRVDNEIRGVLQAESTQRNRFTDEDQHFFEAATRWVGMIAKRAELTETMREGAAAEARQLAADELVTALAHDLGNHLTPLKGRITMMLRRFDREGRERDVSDAREALRAASNIQQMVNRLLDVARIDQGLFSLAPQPIDLVPLLAQVAEDMRGAGDRIETHLADELEIEGDPMRLTETLMNLAGNAIQHSTDGMPIVITADTEQRDDGAWAVVSIADRGPGIEPQLLPHLFDRFAARADSPGLGLGLYLSQRIVEAHGGTLTVSSSPGKGTTFTLALPYRSSD